MMWHERYCLVLFQTGSLDAEKVIEIAFAYKGHAKYSRQLGRISVIVWFLSFSSALKAPTPSKLSVSSVSCVLMNLEAEDRCESDFETRNLN